jgi:hypothetical protein
MERRSGDRACRPSRPTVVPSVCAGGMAAGACSVGWEHALTHLLKSSLSGVSAWLDTNLPGAAGIFLCPFETAGSHRRMGGLSRRRASGRGWRSTFYKCAHECTERCICHSSTHSPLKQQRAIVALVVRVASAAHCNVFVCEAIVRRPRQAPHMPVGGPWGPCGTSAGTKRSARPSPRPGAMVRRRNWRELTARSFPQH